MKARIRYLLGIPFVRDLTTLQIASGVSVAMGVVSSVAYARMLGVEQYGVYAIVTALAGTLGAVANFGQAPAVTTFFAERYGHQDKKGMGTVVQYFLWATAISTLITVACAWFALRWSQSLYGSAAVGPLTVIALAAIPLNAIPGFFLSVMQTVRSIRLMSILEQSMTVLTVALAVALMAGGYGIAGILVARLIVLVAFFPLLAALYLRLQRSHPLPRWSDIAAWNPSGVWAHAVQGAWIGIDKTVGNLYPHLFFSLLGTAAAPGVVGIARIAVQVSLLPRMAMLNQANQLATTSLATLAARGTDALRTTCVRLLKHVLALHAGITFAAMITFPFIIPLFYGADYSAAVTPALWLALISILSAFNVNNTPVLRVMRRTYVSTLCSIISIGLSCALLMATVSVWPPLVSFVAAVGLYYAINQSITVYLYGFLLRRPL